MEIYNQLPIVLGLREIFKTKAVFWSVFWVGVREIIHSVPWNQDVIKWRDFHYVLWRTEILHTFSSNSRPMQALGQSGNPDC